MSVNSGPAGGDPNPGAPAPIAEPGTSTSELKVLIATGVIDTINLALSFGVHLTSQQQTAIEAEAGFLTAVAAVYILGRSIRKIGTNG